jgi:hypothetical protein
MQETGKEEEEIDRVDCWKRARQNKKGEFDPNVKKIVDKIVSFYHIYSLINICSRFFGKEGVY